MVSKVFLIVSNKPTNIVSLLYQDAVLRLRGQRPRANALWGLVKPPAGRGKVIGIRAGASRDSVMLGAGLMAAIRQKRRDVRLVLIYDTEYPDILVEYFSGLEKIGFGFAAADIAAMEGRLLRRLQPFAMIFSGEPAGKGIARALQRHPVPHLLNFQTTNPNRLAVELDFPNQQTGEGPGYEAMSLLVQSQVDKQLSALLTGGGERPVFLLHGLAPVELQQFLSGWQESALADRAILCLGMEDYTEAGLQAMLDVIRAAGFDGRRFSQWDRRAAAKSEIFLIDEWRWFAAVAVAAQAIHLVTTGQASFWQSLASASVISRRPFLTLPVALDLPELNNEQLLQSWQSLPDKPFVARQTADENRRIFWDYRRRAQAGMADLLQRIYDW